MADWRGKKLNLITDALAFLVAVIAVALIGGLVPAVLAAAEAAQPIAEGDRARAALLAAVSHDLRTPLAAAKAAVSGLRSSGIQLTAEDHDELLATADESLGLLTHLVTSRRQRPESAATRARPAPVLPVLTAEDRALCRPSDGVTRP
jgi:two-component system sensor histidine kinase KdpD